MKEENASISKNECSSKFENNTAYKEFSEKHYTNKEITEITKFQSCLIFEFSLLVGTNPNSDEASDLVIRWKNYITKYFYTCTNEILSGLSDIYINDLRFKTNLDTYKENTAKFMSKAIKCYLKK